MNTQSRLERNFDYGSFLPLLLFILGVYICFLFGVKRYSHGVFVMLFAFVAYIVNNLVVNLKSNVSVFNQYLEDLGVFISFVVPLIIFGLMFYGSDFFIMLIIFFYSVCQALNLARNSVLSTKNSKGWPAPLNGLFFPLTFYVYLFYLQGPGDSIFIAYFILIAMLSVSEYNFLGYEREEEMGDARLEMWEKKDKEIKGLRDEEIKSLSGSVKESNGWRDDIKREKEREKEKEDAINKHMKDLREEEHQEKIRLEKEKKILKEIEEKAIKRAKEQESIDARELKEKEKKEHEIKQKEEIEKKKKEKLDGRWEMGDKIENKKRWYDFSFFKKEKKSEDKKEEIKKDEVKNNEPKKKESEKYDDYEDEFV